MCLISYGVFIKTICRKIYAKIVIVTHFLEIIPASAAFVLLQLFLYPAITTYTLRVINHAA